MSTKRSPYVQGVPLAMIIKRKIDVSPDLVMIHDPRSVHAERFRRLKTTIVHRYGDNAQVIVVTSAIPGEGKSTVSLNLALAFAAQAGDKTLLIDCDLRRPTIGGRLTPPPQLGLTEVVSGEAQIVHAVLHLENTSLAILPSGSKVADPLELLTSSEFKSLIRDFRAEYDRIIIDTPPIVPFTDADAIGASSDGVLLVARAGVTPKVAFRQGIGSVTSTRILGIVMNDSSHSLADSDSYYDKYYASYYSGKNDKNDRNDKKKGE